MSGVVDAVSNDEVLRSIVLTTGSIVGTSLGGSLGGLATTAALSYLFSPDIETLEADVTYGGATLNSVNTLENRKIIYGERTVGGSIFHRTATSNVNFEDVSQDQTNQYLHLFLAMAGHECNSISDYFINDSKVTLDTNNMVDEIKYMSSITYGGVDISTQVEWDVNKWYRRELRTLGYFLDNQGRIYVEGLPPNETFNVAGTKMEIEGYSWADWLYGTWWSMYWLQRPENWLENGINPNNVIETIANYAHITAYSNNPIFASSGVVFPSESYSGLRQIPFEFTIYSNFSTDSSGKATVIVDRQPLTDDVLYNLPPHRDENSEYSSDFTDSWISTLTTRRWTVNGYNPPVIGNQFKVVRKVKFESDFGLSKGIRIITGLGTSNQTVTDPDVVDAYKSNSDSIVNLGSNFCQNIPYVHATCRYHPSLFNNIGIPNFQIKYKGKKCFDPRTSSTAWTDNPVVQLYDYMTSTDYGMGINANEIDTTSFNAAANICDESVAISGGTEKRYTSNLVLSMGDNHKNNVNQILSTFAGTLVWVEGKYKCYAGAWATPSNTIDESWLDGGINVSPKESKRELFNGVKGVYLNTDGDQEELNEFPTVTSSSYQSIDNNEQLLADINLLGTVGVERAQRLAKIYLQRHRYSETIQLRCNYKALKICVMDTVYFNSEILGYSNKSYRVLSWSQAANGSSFDLTLRHETSDVYSWTTGEGRIPEITSMLALPNFNAVASAGKPELYEEFYETNSGSSVKTKIKGTFAPAPDAFVSHYRVEYKLNTSSSYTILGNFKDNNFEILDVKNGKYDVRVLPINNYGVEGTYSNTSIEVLGLSIKPKDVTSFGISIVNNNARLFWDLSSDIDVKIAGKYIIKHSSLTTGYSWSNANTLLPNVSGSTTTALAPLLSGTYMIKAEDSTGNQSEGFAELNVVVPNLSNLNVIVNQNEHTSFLGTKNGMEVANNTLMLMSELLFDGVDGDFDDATGNFDSGGGGTVFGFNQNGSYEFNNYQDLGKVVNSRVTLNSVWSLIAPTGDFDDATGFFDDRAGDFDGVNGHEDVMTVTPFIQTTNNDPAGSTPNWSDWKPFYAGDYLARAFKFKVDVYSKDTNFNLNVSELSVTIDMPDIVDSSSCVTLNTGALTVNYNLNFHSSPTINGTIVNSGSGDYINITNVTSNSFDIEVKNSSNANISKTVFWLAKGY